jgi:hypothetical protein
MMRSLLVAAVLLVALPIHPKHPPLAPIDLTIWEWVLVPTYVASPQPGAYGSLWTQRLTAYNGAEMDLVFPVLPCGSCNQTGLSVPPRSTRELVLDPRYPFPSGLLLWINRNAADQAAFSLNVFDVNAPEFPPASIPVLRSRDLHRQTAQILDVPVDDDVRSVLRLYMVTQRTGYFEGSYAFAVRVFRPTQDGPDVLLAERLVTFTLFDMDEPTVFVRYAAISDLFSGIDRGPVRVEIEPLGHEEGFWAFVASVHNVTRGLSVHMPHQ